MVDAALETERLVLRRPVEADLDALAAFFADPEVTRFIGDGRPQPREQAAERLATMIERWRADGFGLVVLERKEDGAVVGRSGLLAWDPRTWRPGAFAEIGDDAETELGWMLGRAYWGRGYATEAARAVRDWAWRELAPTRLISLIHVDNARSHRVAERLGARPAEQIVTHRGAPATVWEHPR